MLAALVVGALTAWYLGLNLGIVVAVITAGALVLAMFIPGMSLAVYALVVAWCAALYFFGPNSANAALKRPAWKALNVRIRSWRRPSTGCSVGLGCVVVGVTS